MKSHLNRKQRRQAGITEKPKVYTMTEAQIEKIKADAVREANAEIQRLRAENEALRLTLMKRKAEVMAKAVHDAFMLFMSIPVMVLHDKFGFGKIRFDRFMNYVLMWYESVQNGEFTIEHIVEIAESVSGIKFVKEVPENVHS